MNPWYSLFDHFIDNEFDLKNLHVIKSHLVIFFSKSIAAMSLICNDYGSGSVSVELSPGFVRLTLNCIYLKSVSLSHHSLSYLIFFSCTLLLCHCMYLHFILILAFSQQQRKWPGSEGVQNAQARGRDVRQERGNLTSHSGTSQSLPLGLLLLSFHSANCPSLLLVHGGTGGSGQVRSREHQSFWIPGREDLFGLLGSGGCGCFSEDLREGGLWTVLSLQWCLYHAFSAIQFRVLSWNINYFNFATSLREDIEIGYY